MAETTDFEAYNEALDFNTLPIYTHLQLGQYNGTDRPEIYVGIRGYVYDVSGNLKNYGPGKSYHRLVGKDVSRLLGLNRLQVNEETGENTWYTGDFDDGQNAIVDKWVVFFRKRYRIVGVIVDHEIKK